MRMCLRAALGALRGRLWAALSPSTSLKPLAPRELRGESPFLPLVRPPPPANGVDESCLSKVKNHYKRQKLNKLVNEEELDLKQLIHQSVNQLRKCDIINSIGLA